MNRPALSSTWLSWVDQFNKIAPLLLGFVMIANLFSVRSPQRNVINNNNNNQKSAFHGISMEKSRILTAEKRESSLKRHNDSVLLMKSIGLPTDNDLFVSPVFPTIFDDGRPIGSHSTIFKEESIEPIVSLEVYFLDSQDSEYVSTSPDWSIDNIHLDWHHNATKLQNSINYTIESEFQNRILHSQKNVWCHVLILSKDKNAFSNYPQHPLDESATIILRKKYPMIKYKKISSKFHLKSLLSSNESSSLENSANDSLIAFWQPTVDLSFVLDIPEFPRNGIPDDLLRKFDYTEYGFLYPLLYRNDFWTTTKTLIEIKEDLDNLPVNISYTHISFWKWQLQTTLQTQERKKQSMGLGGTDSEVDLIREILLDTSPWLLALTVLVTLMHSLFDFLAFKNDIQFWRGRKDMRGLSMGSLYMNCFSQTIILLYLFDNETSTMILVSSSIGLVIEYWKLSKTIRHEIVWNGNQKETQNLMSWIPKLKLRLSSSYVENETSNYDQEAVAHLIYVISPAIVGYSVYSLIYEKYKSFYSWILNSLVGFIYMFGFIMMTPQLYVNYRLKSVAHMPWNAMVYKTLNTFIDDLFAFIIKMPILHRLACFRDDVIFFLYLYQRWIYRTDYNRMNEFGQEGNKSDTTEE